MTDKLINTITFPFRALAYIGQFWALSFRYQQIWGTVSTPEEIDQFYAYKGAAVRELRTKWGLTTQMKQGTH